MLLRDGAEVLLDSESVIDRIRENVSYRYEEEVVEDIYSKIKDLISIRPMSLDEIINITGDKYDLITKVLTDLELQGDVQLRRGKYILTIRS